MALARRPAGAIKRPGKQTAQLQGIEAFNRGINSVSTLSDLMPGECHYCYNILPSEGGPRTRLGTREWTNGITGTPKTIIPFHGKTEDRTDDKLFVTGSDGIYDCSSSGAGAATKVYDFVTTGPTAGYGVFINWTADNGNQYIQYADSANGLLEYDAVSNTWAPAAGITGLTVADVRYVMVHKLRIWYVLEDDPNAYYLDVNAKSGAATPFQLGAKYKIGGNTVALYNHTRDSGDGLDDLFVAVSRGGDVLVYQGLDPSSATTWSLVGSWSIGSVPAGRRIGIEYSGDVILLSANGINSLEELFQGYEADENITSIYGKLTNQIRNRMPVEINTEGWEINHFSAEGYLVIQSPRRQSRIDEWLQYCLHYTLKGWGYWRDIESQAMGSWRETFYFTKADGSVWYMNGTKDNVDTEGENGVDINFSFLTRFSDMELPGRQKQASFARPFFVGSNLTSYDAKVIYDYAIIELVSTGEVGINTGFLWDTGLWDQALWSGETPIDDVFGTQGMGLVMAVAVRGQCGARITLAEISVPFKSGGFL